MRLNEVLVVEGRNAVKDVSMHKIRAGKGGGVRGVNDRSRCI